MLSVEDFKKEAKDALKLALAEASTEDRLQKMNTLIETANSTVTELLETVELKDQELAQASEENENLKRQVEELLAKTKELDERYSAKDVELKEALEKAQMVESELNKIALDRRLELRVNELAEAKILKADEKLVAQKVKIREMSDEDFASYKEELIDLRQTIELALQEKANNEIEEEGTVEVAPPEINKEEGAVVQLNVEEVTNTAKRARTSELMSTYMKLRDNKGEK